MCKLYDVQKIVLFEVTLLLKHFHLKIFREFAKWYAALKQFHETWEIFLFLHLKLYQTIKFLLENRYLSKF